MKADGAAPAAPVALVPAIDGARLWRNLMALADITEPDRPWTRRSFTPRFLEGRGALRALFEAAGLETGIDAGGNLIGRRQGAKPGLAPIMLGSHSDTVNAGGRFDGVLGVLAALEVAQTLAEHGAALRHPLEVADFLAEEPSAFGPSCIGARALSGDLTPAMLALTDETGRTLADAVASVGGDPARIPAAARGPGAVAAYLEIHIEQARALEAAAIPIGVVTGIAAIRRERIRITGRADHAGATPMALRSDALVAASGFITGVSEAAGARADPPLVATIGALSLSPNAANAVPGEVETILEARCGSTEALADFIAGPVARMLDGIEARGFAVERAEISQTCATPCDPHIMRAIETAAAATGAATIRLPSGAGHDGVFISRLGPFGMIFTPCLDGRSHAPEEWADEADCARAAQTLLGAVLALDAAPPGRSQPLNPGETGARA